MGSLILARHSITEASAAGRNLGQRSDLPLAPAGVELAARLGVALAAELEELPHDEMRLVTSPARRCRETAEVIAGR
jgi:broad specificity phosphatase PhoE